MKNKLANIYYRSKVYEKDTVASYRLFIAANVSEDVAGYILPLKHDVSASTDLHQDDFLGFPVIVRPIGMP